MGEDPVNNSIPIYYVLKTTQMINAFQSRWLEKKWMEGRVDGRKGGWKEGWM